MGSSFNPQILVEKLAKLNNSQASIETLSHWCIFHMNKAKHVVETWDRQFHCAPREQRLAYLYLANDILQNSRRKGSEFVGEFWKVLPDALRDVTANSDELGRNAALRLINIWEDRKVFGSRGQILKEEFLGRRPENGNKNGRHVPVKLRQANGSALEKVVSAVESLYGGQIDEDVILGKCSSATSYLEKVGKEVEGDLSSGHPPGPAVVKEVQGQHSILRECMEQLKAIETARKDLVSHLREALHEQELKLEKIQNELQVSQSQSDRTGDLCRQLLDHSTPVYKAPEAQGEQSAPVMYGNPTQTAEEETRKLAAAAVAAKLTESTSSAQMLSYVFSSLASEGIIGNPSVTEPPSSDYPPEKRPKLSDHDQPYIPPQQQPAISFAENLQHNAPMTSSASGHLPSPLLPPFQQPPQFLQPLQPPGPTSHALFSYSMSTAMAAASQQQSSSVPGYTPPAAATPFTSPPPPVNSYQKCQGSEGFYGVNLPITRQ
ncbi:PREDICTED: regulation of nuclear pre-mRNA domain-containing protein 1B [Tarenaya hassleriana]|uniref:regulation of nuclear pre-mRNA domain-containing protein 1B n=1 Tax=Tarenaya hassleriana TaxID=28532 RepID=UPI00053C9D0E|nr:PREDICTED: regulation of nuclear pre-mRNA domain-containing protein 1B [Tarenaya hassleriana]